MELEPKDWVYLVGVIIAGIFGLIGSIPVFMGIFSKNKKNNMDALKVAMEIVGMDAVDQLEMKKEIQHLKEILEKKRYKISVIFRLGETPTIEEATIESYEISSP